MQAVTLIIAILGLCTAIASLTWNVVAFALQGARPEVSLYAGIATSHGVTSGPAKESMVNSIQSMKEENPSASMVLAVEIVNRGRLPLHVYSLAVLSEPSKMRYIPGSADMLTDQFPLEIAAGAKANATMMMEPAARLRYAAEHALGKRQTIRLAVSSSRREHRTKPVPARILDLIPTPND